MYDQKLAIGVSQIPKFVCILGLSNFQVSVGLHGSVHSFLFIKKYSNYGKTLVIHVLKGFGDLTCVINSVPIYQSCRS